MWSALALACVYFVRNPERATLDDNARRGAPGRFVRLSDGVTHYDVSGPDTGRTILLVHGFSVPYYIWDSTATALAGAGYRVVRYDEYGRGLSDRPDVSYNAGALRPSDRRAARLASHHRSDRSRRRVDGRSGDGRVRGTASEARALVDPRRSGRGNGRTVAGAVWLAARRGVSVADDGRSDDGRRPGERLHRTGSISRIGQTGTASRCAIAGLVARCCRHAVRGWE